MPDTNTDSTPELPSARRLLRSTAIAAGTAAVLLVTAVLPAEYGVDPTGVGRLLGLTEMGGIKMQLAREAAAAEAEERAAARSNATAPADSVSASERTTSAAAERTTSAAAAAAPASAPPAPPAPPAARARAAASA